MIQFPQPTRPVNSYDSTELINNSFESALPVENPEKYEAKTAAGDQEEEKETLAQVLELIAEWYEKLPASIRSQLNLQMLKGPSEKPKGFKVDSISTRGINGPLEEMKQKLDRFRIRTVQQGGVVQVDEEENK